MVGYSLKSGNFSNIAGGRYSIKYRKMKEVRGRMNKGLKKYEIGEDLKGYLPGK